MGKFYGRRAGFGVVVCVLVLVVCAVAVDVSYGDEIGILLAAKTDGEALAKAIPSGCQTDVKADEWNAKVEAWRSRSAGLLGPAFSDDLRDYPHDCPLEWVRARLMYFMGKLDYAVATSKRVQ